MNILTRDPGVSLHHQISMMLRSAIISGDYRFGSYLPGETALMESFGVSRATVRRALLTLETEKLVTRHQGKGTLVLWESPATLGTSMSEHRRIIERNAVGTTITPLSFGYERGPADVLAALHLPADTALLKVVRIRNRDNKPMWHLTSYLPREIAEHLTRDALETSPMITTLAAAGFIVHRAEDEIGAGLANPIVAKALNIRIGAPLIELTRRMVDPQGVPIGYQYTLIPPERHKLRTVIQSGPEDPILPATSPRIMTPYRDGDGASSLQNNE